MENCIGWYVQAVQLTHVMLMQNKPQTDCLMWALWRHRSSTVMSSLNWLLKYLSEFLMSVILAFRPIHWHYTTCLGFTDLNKKSYVNYMKDVGRIGHYSLLWEKPSIWHARLKKITISRDTVIPTERFTFQVRSRTGNNRTRPSASFFFWGGGEGGLAVRNITELSEGRAFYVRR